MGGTRMGKLNFRAFLQGIAPLKALVDKIRKQLEIHTMIEEEIFYSALTGNHRLRTSRCPYLVCAGVL
jgi:hypothetical protein